MTLTNPEREIKFISQFIGSIPDFGLGTLETPIGIVEKTKSSIIVIRSAEVDKPSPTKVEMVMLRENSFFYISLKYKMWNVQGYLYEKEKLQRE